MCTCQEAESPDEYYTEYASSPTPGKFVQINDSLASFTITVELTFYSKDFIHFLLLLSSKLTEFRSVV